MWIEHTQDQAKTGRGMQIFFLVVTHFDAQCCLHQEWLPFIPGANRDMNITQVCVEFYHACTNNLSHSFHPLFLSLAVAVVNDGGPNSSIQWF